MSLLQNLLAKLFLEISVKGFKEIDSSLPEVMVSKGTLLIDTG